MKLILRRLVNGNHYDSVVCSVPKTLLSSRKALLCLMLTHAGRQWGIEGKDFRVKQFVGQSFLIPFYAQSNEGSETLTIE